MKRKWMIIPIIVAASLIFIAFYPIPEEPSKELGSGVMLESYTMTVMGFMGGTSEMYRIFENGTALYIFYPPTNRTTLSITLSPDMIQRLNDFIDQKKYSQKTHSLIYDFFGNNYAGYYGELMIKDGQKTVKINNDPVISEILSFVRSQYKELISR